MSYLSLYELQWRKYMYKLNSEFLWQTSRWFSQYDSTLFVWNNTQIHGPVWFHVRSSSCSDFNPHLRITVWRRLPFDFQFLKPRENFWKALYVHFLTLPVNSFSNLKKAFCLLTTSFGKVMKVWKKNTFLFLSLNH